MTKHKSLLNTNLWIVQDCRMQKYSFYEFMEKQPSYEIFIFSTGGGGSLIIGRNFRQMFLFEALSCFRVKLCMQ